VTRAAPNKRRLTEGFVAKLKPREDTSFLVWDEHTRGLSVRVEPTGSKSWMVYYRSCGKVRWYRIGGASSIELKDARRLAGRVLFQVAEGKDPQADRRAQRSSGTFEEVATRYVEEYSKRENKSWRQSDRLVRKHLFPKWAKMRAANITRGDVKAIKAAIDSPTVANQTLLAASAIFNWAIREEVANIAANPVKGIKHNKTTSRERVLSDDEIKKFWAAFESADLVRGRALMLLLLTGQRPGEVRHMRREHVQDGWWEMPGKPVPALGWPGTKNEQTHRVWLPSPAKKILAELDHSKGLIFAGPRGKPIGELEEVMAAICEKLGADRATPHDLRRTHGSTITALGFGRDAMNRIQNHKEGGIASVYDRHQYADENRRIMEAVANKFTMLIEGRPDNVVGLRAIKPKK
jgi:integrase